eukprot:1150373-Pelagomonas_calceolata.AAC.7
MVRTCAAGHEWVMVPEQLLMCCLREQGCSIATLRKEKASADAAQESEVAALQRAEKAEAAVEHQVVRRVVEVAAMKAALNAKVC